MCPAPKKIGQLPGRTGHSRGEVEELGGAVFAGDGS